MAAVTSHLYRCPFDPAKDRQDILGKDIRQGNQRPVFNPDSASRAGTRERPLAEEFALSNRLERLLSKLTLPPLRGERLDRIGSSSWQDGEPPFTVA